MVRALVLMLMLQGCAVLGDRRVAAGCQVADGVTTWYALKHGAVETNGLISGLTGPQILAIKLAFAYAIYKIFPPEPHPRDKTTLGALTLLGCVPAAHNVSVIRSLP